MELFTDSLLRKRQSASMPVVPAHNSVAMLRPLVGLQAMRTALCSQSICRRRAAFTLIELLVVIAICITLMSLLIPAFNSIGKATLLTASGNQIVNLANFARENSMSKNAMTALVVLTDPALDNRSRTFTIFELTPPANGVQSQTSDWKQVSKWETLSPGIIADLCTFQDSSQQPLPPLPAFKYGTKTPASYKYAVFLPGGALLGGSTMLVRLSEGYYQTGAASPVYTQPKPGAAPATPADYYNITILAVTGRTKIDRP